MKTINCLQTFISLVFLSVVVAMETDSYQDGHDWDEGAYLLTIFDYK